MVANLIIYCLGLFGFCYIVGHSIVTQWIRRTAASVVFLGETGAVNAACPTCKAVRGDDTTQPLPDPGFGPPLMECNGCHTFGAFIWRKYFYPFKWPILLIECPACLSFWIGLALALVCPRLTMEIASPYFASAIPFALMSCGASAALGLSTGLMRS